MKATIDVPDDLYRRVKAKAALGGRAVREVTMELYRRWLAEEPGSDDQTDALDWLDEWIRLGEATLRDAPDGPTAAELVAEDRRRLERA